MSSFRSTSSPIRRGGLACITRYVTALLRFHLRCTVHKFANKDLAPDFGSSSSFSIAQLDPGNFVFARCAIVPGCARARVLASVRTIVRGLSSVFFFSLNVDQLLGSPGDSTASLDKSESPFTKDRSTTKKLGIWKKVKRSTKRDKSKKEDNVDIGGQSLDVLDVSPRVSFVGRVRD